MPVLSKLSYVIDITVLGVVIYSGLTGDTAYAIAGLGVYALGNVFNNIGNEFRTCSDKD